MPGINLEEDPELQRNLSEHESATIEEWEGIPHEMIQNLIGSIPNRVCEVIRVRGGVTRYFYKSFFFVIIVNLLFLLLER